MPSTAHFVRRLPMLVELLIALVVLALVLYALQLLPLDGTITRLLQVVVIVVVIVWLFQHIA
jgi:hypothetical protein